MAEDINQIKQAVNQDGLEVIAGDQKEMTQEINTNMQPSLTAQPQQETQQPTQQDIPAPVSGEPQYGYYPDQQQPYSEYQDQSQSQYSSYGSETISDITEQIVLEKISPIRAELEKTIDFRNTIESRMEYLDERLKRIEKIIDRLQLSIIQKIGDYASNIEDIKKEIIETQKSFKSMHDKHQHHK